MDAITTKTISEINDKLGWAQRSAYKMKANLNNQLELQDDFWSFLAAFQQAWFYFSKFISEKYPMLSDKKRSELTKNTINDWKENFLSKEEKNAWNILQQLRNRDVHDKPVLPNYMIKKLILKSNGKILTYGGKILVHTTEEFFVLFDEKEYSIDELTKNGISSIQSLMNYLPKI